MKRLVSSVLALTAAAGAQDHLLTVGFADSQGPKGPAKRSYPVARVKDNDRNGTIEVGTEIAAFLKKEFTTRNRNGAFMTDVFALEEGADLAFYFTDSGDGIVVRGVDRNHNGLLDDGEVTEFFKFNSGFAPDSLAARWDAASKRSVVYVALDENPKGIHRLVDRNGDGDAKDAGEATRWLHAGLGLTVPGKSGPVKLTSDAWKRIRVTPKGMLIAYNGGRHVTSVPQNPDMYAFYAIKDVNAKPQVSVWLNTSRINGLKTHPDFDKNGKFPQYDIKTQNTGQSHAVWNDVSLLEIDPTGTFPGFPTYYFSATYAKGTSGRGDVNPASVKVSGLVYAVVDRNFNEQVDAGEIRLFANLSNATVAGVKPFSYKNRVDGSTTINLDNNSGVEVHDLGAADGKVHLYWENGGNDCVVAMADKNRNGTIETGEATQPWFTPGGQGNFPFPFSTQFGPFSQGGEPVGANLLPGPFPPGIVAFGEGCPAPTRGLRPLADAFGGSPKVGNQKLEVAMIRGVARENAALLLGLKRKAQSLDPFGMFGCFLYTDPVFFGDATALDATGSVRLGLPLPNNPWLIGFKVYVQWATSDRNAGGRLPVFTSNALELTIAK